MNAGGSVVGYQKVLNAMRDNGIAGIEVDGQGITFHHESGLTLSADELRLP
jgi:hypothetical protein